MVTGTELVVDEKSNPVDDFENQGDREVSMNIRKVPFSLRERFKILCIQKGYTMTEGILFLMDDAVVINRITGIIADHKVSTKS